MNNKKKMVLGAAFVVAIMALAGVGYAATHPSYEGKTASAGGNFDVDYIVVKLNEEAYSAPEDLVITYDTETSYEGSPAAFSTEYKWTGSDVVQHQLTYETDASEETITLKITPKAADVSALNTAGFDLYYKSGAGGDSISDTTGWTKYVSGDITSIAYNEAGQIVSWAIVPTTNPVTTPAQSAPGETATLPEITYVVEYVSA